MGRRMLRRLWALFSSPNKPAEPTLVGNTSYHYHTIPQVTVNAPVSSSGTTSLKWINPNVITSGYSHVDNTATVNAGDSFTYTF